MTFFLVSIGLSMDTLAVSVTSGAAIKKFNFHYAFKFALLFGAFQALMLLAGWLTGLTIVQYVQNFSHWIAFGLLTLIGIKMIYESTLLKEKTDSPPLGFIILLSLAFATSIDALSVGISFSLLHYTIMLPVLILGVVTFSMSLTGIYIGERFGTLFEKKMALIGGIILILIGIINIFQYL